MEGKPLHRWFQVSVHCLDELRHGRRLLEGFSNPGTISFSETDFPISMWVFRIMLSVTSYASGYSSLKKKIKPVLPTSYWFIDQKLGIGYYITGVILNTLVAQGKRKKWKDIELFGCRRKDENSIYSLWINKACHYTWLSSVFYKCQY